VKVTDGGEFDVGRDGRELLKVKITVEVDGVRSEYTITYGGRGRNNAAVGFATARGDAPRDREADAERLAALIKALTGKRPRVYRMKNGQIVLECGREHLDGFMRYAELADTVERCWRRQAADNHLMPKTTSQMFIYRKVLWGDGRSSPATNSHKAQ
jgi:hypothetical protein